MHDSRRGSRGRRYRRWQRVGLLLAVAAVAPVAAQEPSNVPVPTQQFDCADAFDLLALTATFRCMNYRAPSGAQDKITAVLGRLAAFDLASEAQLADLRIAFCPLIQGTGMVPSPRRVYLDDGLVPLSIDGLAEIVAHELEHVAQFEQLGAREFKCTYVRQMVACGGCQDERHPLEAAAYARQRAVREQLRESAAAADGAGATSP